MVQTAPPAKSALLISRGAGFWNLSIKSKQKTSTKMFLMCLLLTALVYAPSYLSLSGLHVPHLEVLKTSLGLRMDCWCICVTKYALCTADLKQLNWI